MRDLPPFRKLNRDQVQEFISALLTNEKSGAESQLIDLVEYPDGHYRAVFDPRYFVLGEGETEPSKSQWSSLKKKLKRHDASVFVFKEHGEIGGAKRQYYVDFGFMPDLPASQKSRQR
jgi:hypothetical protein